MFPQISTMEVESVKLTDRKTNDIKAAYHVQYSVNTKLQSTLYM